jgi:hypothetical protein
MGFPLNYGRIRRLTGNGGIQKWVAEDSRRANHVGDCMGNPKEWDMEPGKDGQKLWLNQVTW